MGSPSKWNHDHKINKAQHRRDILGFKTSSRPNHETQYPKEEAKRQARKEARREKAASSSSGCAFLALAMAGGVVAALGALGAGIARLVS